ncbi:hypothetical protein EVAR_94016_1 [Eumeta japonica]|uniref:Uncharacterized protein n=1 Tax=Eumeta variegata TaxID=151549 RepID=A0A4C2AEP2_EUMVA|nr:hypothetical protein EVAR_94016_1 [Eumeta japonica]
MVHSTATRQIAGAASACTSAAAEGGDVISEASLSAICPPEVVASLTKFRQRERLTTLFCQRRRLLWFEVHVVQRHLSSVLAYRAYFATQRDFQKTMILPTYYSCSVLTKKVYAHRIILVARSLDTAGLQRRRPSTAPAPADKREEQIARKIEIRQKPSPAPPTQTMLLPKLLGPFVDSVTKELD